MIPFVDAAGGCSSWCWTSCATIAAARRACNPADAASCPTAARLRLLCIGTGATMVSGGTPPCCVAVRQHVLWRRSPGKPVCLIEETLTYACAVIQPARRTRSCAGRCSPRSPRPSTGTPFSTTPAGCLDRARPLASMSTMGRCAARRPRTLAEAPRAWPSPP